MENFFPTILLELLSISVTFSVILMMIIQKFKDLSFFNKSWKIWLLSFIFSFGIGIPFTITFYNTNIINSLWVGLFSFIGASAIYEGLKNQKFINYTPKSSSNTKTLDTKNEIKRDEK